MKKFLVILTAFIFYVVAFSASKALIIYVSQFKNSEITPLKYAKNDAEHFKETLIKLGLVPDENITFLENPTYVEMKVAIKKFFKTAKSSDVIYFFYSGHGYYDEKHSKTYFIPYDTDPSYFQDTAYSIEDNLKELLLETKAKVFMFVDACYSGSIGKDKPLRFKHFSRESLKEIASRSNVALILSSSSNETSKEDDKLKGGVFTYYLIEGLKGKANLNGDEEITLKELAEYVKEKVSEETMNSQHPQMIASAAIEDSPVAIDYSKVELKALEKLKKLSGVPGDVKEIVGRIVMQSSEKDTEIESKVRKYIRDFGLGKIEAEYLVDFITSNLDKLKSGVSYGYTPPQESKSQGFGTLKIYITQNEAAKDAFVVVNGERKPASDSVIFEKVPSGRVTIIVDGPYMEKYQTQINLPEFETLEVNVTPSKATAALVVDSNPQGADVYIDGKKLSYQTPFTTKVPVGKHEIMIKRSGYVPEKRIIDFKKGKVYEVKNIILKRKPERLSIYCPSDMLIGQEESCTIKAIYNDRPSEEVPLSKLNVTIHGDAVVLSEGKIKAAVSGNAIIEFEYGGVSERREINVHYGKLIVDSNPKGADIYIDGEYKGTTPLSVYLAEPTVNIKLKKKGFEEYRKTITIEKGKNTTFSAILSEEVEYIEANLPDKMVINEMVELNVEATGYLTIKKLRPYEYDVKIEGDSVEYSSGYLIARKAGSSKVIISYKGARYEKDIEVILGKLKITSTPSGANVYIDGKYVGTTPITVDVTKKTFPLSVSKQGYEKHVEYVYFTPGKDKEIHISLPEKISSIKTNIPDIMVAGDEIKLDVTLIKYYTQKKLNSWEYFIDISDTDVLEFKNGKLIAKNPGTAIVKVKYEGKEYGRKVVNVYYGLLSVTSSPSGANVYIDGEYIGTTPLYDIKISNSYVSLSVRKEGYEEYTKYVYFTTVRKRNLNITLVEKIKSIEADIPGRMVVGEVVDITPKLIKYHTQEKLNSWEYAVDISDTNVLEFRYGKLVAKNPGIAVVRIKYKGKEYVKKTVDVYYASIRIASSPSWASIYHNGNFIGTTPKTIYIISPIRTYTVKVSKSGYYDQTKTVYLAHGGSKSLYVTLSPKPTGIRVYGPSEMKLGDILSKSAIIRVSLEYKNGSEKILDLSEVNLKVTGALTEYGSYIKASKVGEGIIEVSYKGMSDYMRIKVYKTVKITSIPSGASIYTPYGSHLGTTPYYLKLTEDRKTIVLKKSGYFDTTKVITITPYQNSYTVKLNLPLEDKVAPLLNEGKIEKVADVIKQNNYKIIDVDKDDIINAVKEFNEYKLKHVTCTTTGCRLYKEYAIRYIEEVKKAIKEKDAKKAAKLLKGLYPEISKALQSSEKPWSKALNAASERLIEIEGLVDNARYEGSEIKMVKKVTKWNASEKDHTLFGGIGEANVGYLYTASTTPSWYQNINGKAYFMYNPIGPIKVDEKGVAKGIYWYFGGLGLGDGKNRTVDTDYMYRTGVAVVGIGYYMTKPLREGSDIWWFANIGIGTNPMVGGIPAGVHLRTEAKLGWMVFYINLGAEAGYSYVDIEDPTTDFRHRCEWSSYFTFYIGLGLGAPFSIKPASSIKLPYADIH